MIAFVLWADTTISISVEAGHRLLRKKGERFLEDYGAHKLVRVKGKRELSELYILVFSIHER